MITYHDYTNGIYYDFQTLASILRVTPSYLKRAISKYGFDESDFIRYNNRHLYAENAVVDFIIYLIIEKLYADLHHAEVATKKYTTINE